jgi:hypothetical protein
VVCPHDVLHRSVYALVTFTVRVTSVAHLILFDLITIAIVGAVIWWGKIFEDRHHNSVFSVALFSPSPRPKHSFQHALLKYPHPMLGFWCDEECLRVRGCLQLRTADKVWSFSLVVGRGDQQMSTVIQPVCYETFYFHCLIIKCGSVQGNDHGVPTCKTETVESFM